ncbi:hypothetical protein ABW20_dc0108272 [Dactylellina cionopaga]|nr:hypothetical protein ABW20_dc0108272 [Dactylellina cionopaga]
MYFFRTTTFFYFIIAISAAPSIEPRNVAGTTFWPYIKSADYSNLENSMEARFSYFHIGPKSASVGCSPKESDSRNCPKNATTQLMIGLAGTASLQVAIPRGQRIYIDKFGALRYTPPGNFNIPKDSTVTGFRVDSGRDKQVIFSNVHGSMLACPLSRGGGEYRIYIDVKGKTVRSENTPLKDRRKCITVSGLGTVIENKGSSIFWSYRT